LYNKIAINCENITVEYISPTEASRSLKESFISFIKGSHRPDKHFNALKNVSVQIKQGECVGFIGPNGCGKSTLLKVIAGVISPQKGRVSTEGIIAPLIELGAGFDPELTGVENIRMSCALMGVPKKTISKKLDQIIAFAELGDFIKAPLKTYSSGMYMRLGFACATIIEPNILLIDEILAVGDARFQSKCLDLITEIQSQKNTIAMVSHERSMIEKMCSRAIFLWHGQVRFEGDCSTAFDIYNAVAAQNCTEEEVDQFIQSFIQKRQVQNTAAPTQEGQEIIAATEPQENAEIQESAEPQENAEIQESTELQENTEIQESTELQENTEIQESIQYQEGSEPQEIIEKPDKLVDFLSVTSLVHERDGIRTLSIFCQLSILARGYGLFNIGLEIRDELSRRVFTTNTKSIVTPDDSKKMQLDNSGITEIKWVYEITPLASGKYLVDLAVSDGDIKNVYEVKPEATSFLVSNQFDPLNFERNLIHLERKEISVY
jgi:ABC-type polysaccharide/polyol phosphate transport system ATPase subunit